MTLFSTQTHLPVAKYQCHWNHLHHLWLSLQHSNRNEVFGSCGQAKFNHIHLAPFSSSNHICDLTSQILPQHILATWSPSQSPADAGQTQVTSPDSPTWWDPASHCNSDTQLKAFAGDGERMFCGSARCFTITRSHITSLRLHLAHKCCSILLKTKYQRICCP